MAVIRVVGAAIVREGKILCAQRGSGKSLSGYWEFPGGKIEDGESEQEALMREIREELRCEISIGRKVASTRFAYDFAEVELNVYLAQLRGQEPDNTEHKQLAWVAPDQLSRLRWAPADHEAVARLAEMTL
ncbi:MAG: (deoxy)nucleoside triphosphate pyrophosphohydrolase [Actinomycetaceae bacterium]|nr:(deoxy)nucleoside triphosphate pyrophosphohydrolase [Actinomycetaceae bacterium]